MPSDPVGTPDRTRKGGARQLPLPPDMTRRPMKPKRGRQKAEPVSPATDKEVEQRP